jgi:hypothetical protein
MTIGQSESQTQLYGTRLWLARAAWGVLALISIAYYIVWAIYSVQLPIPTCSPTGGDCNPYYLTVQDLAVLDEGTLPFTWLARATSALNGLVSLVFILVGLFIVLRKSNDWMALWLSGVILALGAAGTSPDTTSVFPPDSPFYAVVTAIAFFGYFSPFATLFFFPDGRFVPRWCRWVCAALIIPVVVFYFADLFDPQLVDTVIFIFLPWLPIIALIGIGSLVYRYRRVANPQQRQQIKWVAFGLCVGAVNVIVWILYEMLLPATQPHPTRTVIVALTFPFLALLLPVLPISVAIAVIRYRLWDVDVLIRRTVTYALVTALLALVFFGSIVLLQQLFATLTGARQNEIVTVISTLAIAALFVPLRNRVQTEIDKRFNRKKYDAQQVLNDFATTVRDETNLENLTGRLMQVVDETMQPRTVSVWLKQEEEGAVPRR